MKLKKFLVILFAGFLLFGCSALRKDLIKITESDIKNAEASRIAAENLLSTWLLNSGFIRGALGPERMAILPLTIIKAMDELDELARKTDVMEGDGWKETFGKYTDYELGYSLGLRVRLLGTVVEQALKLYAPEVLKYIPLAL